MYRAMRIQRGFTIVELMIALALGLIVVLAALTMYLTSANNSRLNREQARMTAEADTAMSQLGAQLRMGGYSTARKRTAASAMQSRPFEGLALRGCDGGFTNAASASDPVCDNGSGPDALAIYYEADRFNARGVSGGVLDCQGSKVLPTPLPDDMYLANGGSDASERYLVQNRYYFRAAAGGELVCSGNGGAAPFTTAVVMLGGVEDFQIVYSALRPGSTGIPARATAKQVAAAYATEEGAWMSVQSAHICFILVSATATVDSPTPYAKCDGTIANPNDRRLRRRFESSFALRNQIPAGL